jgi:hypothetical protein
MMRLATYSWRVSTWQTSVTGKRLYLTGRRGNQNGTSGLEGKDETRKLKLETRAELRFSNFDSSCSPDDSEKKFDVC